MKKKEAGDPAKSPRNTTDASVKDTSSCDGKKVSVDAVKSVAGQYGISASLFREWLEGRGFVVQEQQA